MSFECAIDSFRLFSKNNLFYISFKQVTSNYQKTPDYILKFHMVLNVIENDNLFWTFQNLTDIERHDSFVL